MRPTSALLAVGILPAALALPVVTAAAPKPTPVAPHVRTLDLSGVDTRALAAVPGRSDRPVLLTPQTRTSRFDLVAVTWDDASTATTVQVRVREHGAWTGWETLAENEDGPDAGSRDLRAQQSSGRTSSESLLVDGADGVQVRIDGARAPHTVRAELVDGGRSKADSQVSTIRRASSTAVAEAAQPAIVTRAQWGADESLRGGSPSYTGTPKVGFIHHTASTNAYGPGDAAAQVRAIYAYHTKVNHWSDIGYNYLVDQYGTVYEGRAGGIDRNVMGAHTGGFNSDSFAVSELGNFQTAAAPDVMVSSVEQVLAWRLSLAHVDPAGSATLVSAGGGTSRYRAGASVTVPTISGHRDVGATACPGADLYARIPEIRTAVQSLTGPSIFAPSLSPTRIPVGPDGRALPGAVSLAARTSDPQSWSFSVADPSGRVVAQQSGSTSPGNLSVSAAWNRTVDGAAAPSGTYAVTLSSLSPAGAVRSYASSVVVAAPAPVAPAPAAPAAPAPPPAPVLPDPPTIALVYTSPGKRERAGRPWSTTCIDYGTTHRCTALTLSSYYAPARRTGKITQVRGMLLSANAYSVRWTPAWDGNPYAVNGMRTIDGKLWLVTCNVPSGPRVCNVSLRTKVWERVVVKKAGAKDRVTFRQHDRWKPNRIYRLYVTK